MLLINLENKLLINYKFLILNYDYVINNVYNIYVKILKYKIIAQFYIMFYKKNVTSRNKYILKLLICFN